MIEHLSCLSRNPFADYWGESARHQGTAGLALTRNISEPEHLDKVRRWFSAEGTAGAARPRQVVAGDRLGLGE